MPSLGAAFQSVVAELAAAIEPILPQAADRPPLTVVSRNGGYEAYRTDRDPPVALGRLDAAGGSAATLPRDLLSRPAEIRLDAAQVLSKALQLPAASRHYLHEVVSHQLERMTPWSADRVVFDYALDPVAPAGRDQLCVRLVATSREVFEKTLAELAKAGIEPAVVGTAEDPIDRPSPVNLFRAGKTGRQHRLRRAVGMALGGIAAAGLLFSALSGWRLHAVSSAAERLQAEMAAARETVARQVSGLQSSESRGRVLAEKEATAPVVVLLDRLSGLIPTSTYLTELAVEGEQLRLAGVSGDAPALIGILEDADLLSDVRFAAPTIRDEALAQDRFEITARLIPSAGAP